MKEFFKKIWDAVKAFFVSLPAKKYLCFIAGMFLTALLAIVFPGAIGWPFVPVVFLAVIIGFVKVFSGKKTDWWSILSVVLGALSIQLLCWIG